MSGLRARHCDSRAAADEEITMAKEAVACLLLAGSALPLLTTGAASRAHVQAISAALPSAVPVIQPPRNTPLTLGNRGMTMAQAEDGPRRRRKGRPDRGGRDERQQQEQRQRERQQQEQRQRERQQEERQREQQEQRGQQERQERQQEQRQRD